MTELFTVKKLFPYGEVEKLVLARFFYQPIRLLEAVQFSNEEKDKIAKFCMDNLVPKAIHCGNLVQELATEADEQISKFSIEGNIIQNMPHIVRLEERSGDFLYNAKNLLRDLAALLKFFFGTNFNEASQWFDAKNQDVGDIAKWMTEKYGANDRIVQFILHEQGWIKETIRKRNAFEHPGGKSGTMVIKNFDVVADGQLAPPRWTRDIIGKDIDLIHDLQDIYRAALFFCEDMVAICIEKNLKVPLLIGAIPQDQQDKDVPVRLQYFLKLDSVTEPQNFAASGPV